MITRKLSSRDEIIPVYGEMPLTVYTFLLRWNFIPGRTHPCQKDRDEISSRGEKKTKKTCKHFIPGWNFKMSIFFKIFDVAFKYAFQSLRFEHNTSMNIMKQGLFIKSEVRKKKGWGQQVKYKNFKTIFIISIIFFVKFRKDWNFFLL